MSTASLRVRSWPICLASVGEIRDRAQYDDRQGAWSRCADIDPAERGRVDRIGIPQRKKTGSPTAAMGLNVRFARRRTWLKTVPQPPARAAPVPMQLQASRV